MKIRNAWEPTKPRIINLKNILMAFASNRTMVKDLLFTRLLKMIIVSFLVVMVRHKCLLSRIWQLLNLILMLQLLNHLNIKTCLKPKRMKIWNRRIISFKLCSSFLEPCLSQSCSWLFYAYSGSTRRELCRSLRSLSVIFSKNNSPCNSKIINNNPKILKELNKDSCHLQGQANRKSKWVVIPLFRLRKVMRSWI